MDTSFLKTEKIIPVVVLHSISETLPTLNALKKGGINTAEITFRTECAEEAIRLAVSEFPDMIIGAGTVINGEQCERAVKAGARFIVSPGFSEEVLDCCKKYGLTYFPGAATATEIMNVISKGISVIKFFPAEALGGLKTLKALSSAFPGVRFMPTGGINPDNFIDYLSLPYIEAIGGSWMIKKDHEETAELSREACEKVKSL